MHTQNSASYTTEVTVRGSSVSTVVVVVVVVVVVRQKRQKRICRNAGSFHPMTVFL